MIKISNNFKIGTMKKGLKPAATAKSGDIVVFETMDWSDGAVTSDGDRDWTEGKFIHNPATGPLYVEGAEEGDLLKVEIQDIQTRSWGAMGTGFEENLFVDLPGEYTIKTFDVSDGFVKIGNKKFPAEPMIGVIGVAPVCEEGVETGTPDLHGGNMDCTLMKKGAAAYFPVNTPGALLAMGDLHIIMGDGEVFEYGLETSGLVTVKVSVIKGAAKEGKIRMPLVHVDGKLAAIGSALTLEGASKLAIEQIFDILVNHGWDRYDAGWLMSMKCNLAICQTVDPEMTVRAEIADNLVNA